MLNVNQCDVNYCCFNEEVKSIQILFVHLLLETNSQTVPHQRTSGYRKYRIRLFLHRSDHFANGFTDPKTTECLVYVSEL